MAAGRGADGVVVAGVILRQWNRILDGADPADAALLTLAAIAFLALVTVAVFEMLIERARRKGRRA